MVFPMVEDLCSWYPCEANLVLWFQWFQCKIYMGGMCAHVRIEYGFSYCQRPLRMSPVWGKSCLVVSTISIYITLFGTRKKPYFVTYGSNYFYYYKITLENYTHGGWVWKFDQLTFLGLLQCWLVTNYFFHNHRVGFS